MRPHIIWTASACALSVALPTQIQAQTRDFNVAPGPLRGVLNAYIRQSGRQVIFKGSEMTGVRSDGVRGSMSADDALDQILKETGYRARKDESGALAIVRSPNVSSAKASEAVDVPSAPAVLADASTTGEIIVTARKRVENMRDVPVSIVAVSGGELTSAKITQLVDLVARVPSLTMATGANSGFAQIRGLGTGNNPSFDQAVGKFIDNVSHGRDQDIRLPLFDVERVEVLKGPQVLLYGNSTTAGALNITTRKPKGTLQADANASYEFRSNEVVLQGGVTLPLSTSISLRLAGLYQDLARGDVLNTLTQDRVPTTNTKAGRATLSLDPGGDVRFLIKAEYDQLRNRGAASELFVPPGFGPFPFPDTVIDGRTAVDNNVAPFFQPTFNALDNQTYQMDANYDVFGGTLTSTTGYRTSQYAGSTPAYHPIPVAHAFIANKYRQFSQELRFSGSYGALDLTIGGFYQRENLRQVNAIDFNVGVLGLPVPPFAANFILHQKTDSYSAFGDVTYRLTDALSLEAGVRVTRVTRDASQSSSTGDVFSNKSFGMGLDLTARNTALDPIYGFFFGTSPHFFNGLRFRDTFVQPQIVLQYKPSSYNQLYAKFVRGEKAGGFDSNYPGAPTGNNPNDAKFESESAQAFELGFKGISTDSRFTYALSAFTTTFKNLQTNAFVAQATVSLVTNVGKARSRGFEVELGYKPVPGLRLSATGTYADAKYINFPGAQCTLAGPCPVTLQDLSGKPTIFSSKWSGTLGVDYDQGLGDWVLTGGALLVARSKYNPSTNIEPFLKQHGYAQLDAHLELKPADGPWSLRVFGRNLTDIRYFEFGESVPVTTGALAVYRSRGRQIGIQAGVRF